MPRNSGATGAFLSSAKAGRESATSPKLLSLRNFHRHHAMRRVVTGVATVRVKGNGDDACLLQFAAACLMRH